MTLGAEASFTYVITAGLVYITVSETPTLSDFRALLQALALDHGYRRRFPVLHDRRVAPPPSLEYIRAAAGVLREHAQQLGPCRSAVECRTVMVTPDIQSGSKQRVPTGTPRRL